MDKFEHLLPIVTQVDNDFVIRGLNGDNESVRIPISLFAGSLKASCDFAIFNGELAVQTPVYIPEGTTLTFEARQLTGVMVVIYRWAVIFNNLEIATSNKINPSFLFAIDGTYSVKLEIYDSVGVLITQKQKNDIIIVSDVTNVLQFHAQDSITSTPLENVRITIGGYPVISTDVNGDASISVIGNGTLTFSAELDGYEPYQQYIVAPQASPPKVISLIQIITAFDVQFKIETSEFESVYLAEVVITTVSPDLQAYSDILGIASFTDLPGGTYSYTVNKAGYESVSGTFDLPYRGTILVTLFPVELSIPSYVGYRTEAQGGTLTEAIVKGDEDSTQQELLDDLTQMDNFPDRLKLFHRTRWVNELAGETFYWMWLVVPDAYGKAYTHFKDNTMGGIQLLTNLGSYYTTTPITIDGEPHTAYMVHYPPMDMYFGINSNSL